MVELLQFIQTIGRDAEAVPDFLKVLQRKGRLAPYLRYDELRPLH